MTVTPVEIFAKCGFTPRKPLVERSRNKLFSKLVSEIPAELASFYASCNGGRLPPFGCRIYPLAEAVDLLGAYDFITMFDFLPFFVDENMESDPCMIALSGPLRGFIYHHPHDDSLRVLTPSIKSFAQVLAKRNPDTFRLENETFLYPKEPSQAERKIARKLLEMGESDSTDPDDASRLKELALSMSEERKTGYAVHRMAENKEYEQFLDRCEAIFSKVGIEVVRDDHYGLLVGPKKKAFAWQSLQQRQKRKDFEKYIVGFIGPRLG